MLAPGLTLCNWYAIRRGCSGLHGTLLPEHSNLKPGRLSKPRYIFTQV